jgi:predicted amidophosphoribosyltransferase
MRNELIINWAKHARKWRDFILDLLFPIECLGCGREGEWICQSCFGRIRFNDVQYCFHCKKENDWGQFCASCQPQYFLNGIWIAGDYEDKFLTNMVQNLKYRFARDISQALAKFLTIFLKDLIHRNAPFAQDFENSGGLLLYKKRHIPKIFFDFKKSLIVPVPLHPRRLRWRGFNQAEEIARGVAEYFKIEMRTDILSRVKYRQPQVKLSMKERAENIKGCFQVPHPTLPFARGGEISPSLRRRGLGEVKSPLDKGSVGGLSGRNIILIDDVATTGATLNEAARVLKENGAREVWGLVVAKG